MDPKKDRAPSKKIAGLSQQAEAARQRQSLDTQRLSAEEIEQLIQELRVHQIELEVQNEELHQAQQKLAEAYHEYADLYDFAPVGYFTLDSDGLILALNQTGANQLGRSRRSLMRKPFTLYVAPDSRHLFFLHRSQVFESKSHQTCEIPLVKKDGTLFWARLESILVPDSQGKSSQLRMAVIDITEQVRMATALQKDQRAQAGGRGVKREPGPAGRNHQHRHRCHHYY
jgi:PAS domain S-box-containing protein